MYNRISNVSQNFIILYTHAFLNFKFVLKIFSFWTFCVFGLLYIRNLQTNSNKINAFKKMQFKEKKTRKTVEKEWNESCIFFSKKVSWFCYFCLHIWLSYREFHWKIMIKELTEPESPKSLISVKPHWNRKLKSKM